MKKTYFILTLLSIFLSHKTSAQTEAELVSQEIFKSDIESHIYFLASDELKGRETGTPEIDIAASYIANTLRRYKVKPVGDNGTYYQNIPFENVSPIKSVELSIGNFKSDDLIPVNHINLNFKGNFVLVASDTDVSNMDFKNKVVIVNSTSKDIRRVSRSGRALRSAMQNSGATAVIELVKSDTKTWNSFENRSKRSRLNYPSSGEGITHLWLNDSEGAIAQQFSSGGLNGSLEASGSVKKIVYSKNVVGMVEGSDPELKHEFIIYSAHYDHVGIGTPNAQNDSIYNGARDNAVGTVTVLSAAKSIAKRPTKRSALFILFTAEEKGLLGSKWYVENPVLPLEQMVFCFNSDNGGYNDTSLATIVGLNRTTEGDLIKKAVSEFGLTATDDPTGSLFNRSDNVMFAQKGIPAPTFSLGFTAFDQEIGKYYHQAADNPDTLDYNYLEQFFRAYVLSCRYISDNDNTPFWTEGDTYYDAGKQLYNK